MRRLGISGQLRTFIPVLPVKRPCRAGLQRQSNVCRRPARFARPPGDAGAVRSSAGRGRSLHAARRGRTEPGHYGLLPRPGLRPGDEQVRKAAPRRPAVHRRTLRLGHCLLQRVPGHLSIEEGRWGGLSAQQRVPGVQLVRLWKLQAPIELRALSAALIEREISGACPQVVLRERGRCRSFPRPIGAKRRWSDHYLEFSLRDDPAAVLAREPYQVAMTVERTASDRDEQERLGAVRRKPNPRYVYDGLEAWPSPGIAVTTCTDSARV
jgi:hypothetical protein